MQRRYLEQRHIDLDSGRSCLALGREYSRALEVLAYEYGWNTWRVSFGQSSAEDGECISA